MAALNWCFTINNPTDYDVKKISDFYDDIGFLIYGRETGENGTSHLQGYVQFKKKRRITFIKKVFLRAHLEIAKGNAEQNIKYCSKQDKEPFQYGTPKKTAQESKKDNLYDKIQLCKTWNDVLKVDGVSRCLSYAREVWNNKVPDVIQTFTPRVWQTKILKLIETPADGHTINYVYDPNGNVGKTYLCKYLVCNYGAFYFSPSKMADVFCAYSNQKIILYDIPMSCDTELLNWGIVEKLKDGILFSGKYNSSTKFRQENAHVIVFSNHPLPDGVFSKSRNINKIEISKFDICDDTDNIITISTPANPDDLKKNVSREGLAGLHNNEAPPTHHDEADIFFKSNKLALIIKKNRDAEQRHKQYCERFHEVYKWDNS